MTVIVLLMFLFHFVASLNTLIESLSFSHLSGYTVKLDDVTLYLYTRENPNRPKKISVSNVSELTLTNFKSTRANFFLIHGIFSDSNTLNPYIRPPLLQAADVNVFIVDYSEPASSFATVDEVIMDLGKILATYMVRMMEGYSLSGDNFTLVGHSMGAHVAGEIGRYLNRTVGSIVGIDPARSIRRATYLDPTKAAYVQIIHTSIIIGIVSAMGHADFYVNDIILQPGCFGEPICAHFSGLSYYGDSLISGGFPAVRCGSYSNYLVGNCANNEKAFLGGVNLDKNASGLYYLKLQNRGGPIPYTVLLHRILKGFIYIPPP